MNESKQRIAEYKKLLPDLKERVVAVALLLVISFTMVITTSFAWVVLSRSPEVTGVTTNIASNGNLEIALATGDGTQAPGESKVGDSSAAQSITAANITWGNMINLNDPAYGLDNLVLRPAELNTAALLTSPLYGAEYDADGRIVKLDSSFGYATWVPPTDIKPGYFKISQNQGSSTLIPSLVRACRQNNVPLLNVSIIRKTGNKYMLNIRNIRVQDGITIVQTSQALN